MIGGMVAVPRGPHQVSGNNDLAASGAILDPFTCGQNPSDCPTLAEQFDAWCDQQTLTPDRARTADRILNFLRMPYVPPWMIEQFAPEVFAFERATSTDGRTAETEPTGRPPCAPDA